MTTQGITEYSYENLPKQSGESRIFYLKDMITVALNPGEYITETLTASSLIKVTKKY